MTSPGDRVRILTDKDEFEGLLMPRPDLLEGDITVLKLDTGYNIGIKTKKIKEIKLIKKYSAPKSNLPQFKPKKGLPTVSLLSTGGTISSKIDYRTGGVYADYTAEDFVNMCPEIADHANIKAKKIMSIMSEDMTHEHWQLMAREVEKELNNPDVNGVILTMGTDTLHFVSAALSFFLQDLNKPVIITASQRSIDRGSSDAFMNLSCSVIAASKFNCSEVMTCLHGSSSDDYCLLIRGNKVRKMHTSRRDAFRPINDLPLAKVFDDSKIDIINENFRPRRDSKVIVEDSFESKVALVQIYPGIDGGVIDFYVKSGYKGIILSATALGHVPEKIYSNIENAIKKNVPIIIASQTLYGSTNPNVYSPLRMLSIKLGCIFVKDLLPETAYIKLGWVLGKTSDINEVKNLMLQNISSEFNERSLPDEFLY